MSKKSRVRYVFLQSKWRGRVRYVFSHAKSTLRSPETAKRSTLNSYNCTNRNVHFARKFTYRTRPYSSICNLPTEVRLGENGKQNDRRVNGGQGLLSRNNRRVSAGAEGTESNGRSVSEGPRLLSRNDRRVSVGSEGSQLNGRRVSEGSEGRGPLRTSGRVRSSLVEAKVYFVQPGLREVDLPKASKPNGRRVSAR